MQWSKIGFIFNPLEYKLSDNFVGFAQSPQVVVFDDFVRIYFSTRKRNNNGKFLSYVQFVDMNKTFDKVISTSKHQVIKLGELGCFDEHGIFPFNVLKEKDKILAYTTGWNRKESVSVDAGIGYAESYDNGKTFKKLGNGPVLTSSLYEPFLVGDGFVKNYNNIYHMWYVFGVKWSCKSKDIPPDRVYKIAYATSKDGINWQKEGRQIITSLYEDECQALPTVIKIKNKYHMYFCFRNNFDFRKDKNKGYRIGYAYSEDLINWHRDDVLGGFLEPEGDWDSDMMCYPHIFECDNNIYMLYNGNEFGKYGFGLAKLEKA